MRLRQGSQPTPLLRQYQSQKNYKVLRKWSHYLTNFTVSSIETSLALTSILEAINCISETQGTILTWIGKTWIHFYIKKRKWQSVLLLARPNIKQNPTNSELLFIHKGNSTLYCFERLKLHCTVNKRNPQCAIFLHSLNGSEDRVLQKHVHIIWRGKRNKISVERALHHTE